MTDPAQAQRTRPRGRSARRLQRLLRSSTVGVLVMAVCAGWGFTAPGAAAASVRTARPTSERAARQAAAVADGTSRPARVAGPAARGQAPALPKNVKRACSWPPSKGDVACLALLNTSLSSTSADVRLASSTPAGYSPSDLHSAYDLPGLDGGTEGEGQTVAVVDANNDPKAESDLAVYRAKYGLPPCTSASGCFRKVNEFGQESHYPSTDPGWATEESLDVDMVSAICPNCKILLVEANNQSFGNLAFSVRTAVRLGARYVSNSYGGWDLPANAVDESDYNQPGVAVTVASGDNGFEPTSGAFNFGEELPAALPQVIAVGGTSLLPASNARGWDEIVWTGSGSGCADDVAAGFSLPRPLWQTENGCHGARIANDVAAVADPETGVATYDSTAFEGFRGWEVVGGTSVSSPIIASVYALAGPPDPGTYPASYLYHSHSSMNDIVSGTNLLSSANCHPTYLCNGEPGYDGPTGWGTPDGLADFRAPQPEGYVAMGDSYSAGEGNPPYEPGTDTKKNSCHRSESAYSTMIKWPGQSVPIAAQAKAGEAYSYLSRACSGAETTGVTPAAIFANDAEVKKWNDDHNTDWGSAQSPLPEGFQVNTSALNAQTRLVTISIGGNDARFGDVLAGCLLYARLRLASCSNGRYKLKRGNGATDPLPLTDFEPLVISALQEHLLATYKAIHKKARNAEIVAVGYPLLFPQHPTKSCYTLTVSDQTWLDDMGTDLNEVTAAAVAQASAAGIDIRFVNPAAAFADHALCTKTPWLYGLKLRMSIAVVDPASFHPTQRGQDEYARIINACLADESTC
jgi:hypothetical protein